MVVTEKINIQTKGECDIVDITSEVERKVSAAGIESGTVTVFISGSTAGVTTIEYEPGVVSDFKAMWDRLFPCNIQYGHDQRWGDGNGYSHVRASTLGPSLTVPFSNKAMLLGTWQQIVVVDFDHRVRGKSYCRLWGNSFLVIQHEKVAGGHPQFPRQEIFLLHIFI